MGRGSCSRLIVRVGVLVLAGSVLCACAAVDKFAAKNATDGARLVEEGEPIEKRVGDYKVGRPYQLNGRDYYPAENPHYRAEGIASWYGADFHGRQTANGEIYDMHAISAAHPTLPLPSYVRVTNLGNGRSIIARLNDRGPFAKNRIVDLSVGTAKALGFHGQGLARVRVEYVGRAPREGSDSQMLLATLRHGGPAPAPSVVVASVKPFLPPLGASPGRDSMALPAGRPLVLGIRSTLPAMTAAPEGTRAHALGLRGLY